MNLTDSIYIITKLRSRDCFNARNFSNSHNEAISLTHTHTSNRAHAHTHTPSKRQADRLTVLLDVNRNGIKKAEFCSCHIKKINVWSFRH